MRTAAFTILILAVCLTGCSGGDEDTKSDQKAITDKAEAAMALRYADADIRHRVDRVTSVLPMLELLRMGQTDAAIEMMEHSLDSAICQADAGMRSFAFAEHRPAKRALIEARAYREKYPRSKVAVLTMMGDHDPLHELREEKRRKAEVILQDVANTEEANTSLHGS